MVVIFREQAYLVKYSHKKIIKFCLKEHINFAFKLGNIGWKIIISIPKLYIGKERYVERVMNFINKGNVFK